MEEKDKNKIENPNTVSEEAPHKSNREIFMDGYMTRYPDDDIEDEEVIFGRINDDMNGYNDLKKENEQIKQLFIDNPQYAEMFADAREGRPFLTSFIERFGEEAISAALKDPEKAKEIGEANSKFIERAAMDKKRDEETPKNVQSSLDAISTYQQENGLSDEEITELWNKAIDIVVNGINGNIPVEFIDILYKSKNHDNDVKNAAEEAEIRGRNAQIEEKLAEPSPYNNMPPTLNGSSNANIQEPEQGKRKKRTGYNPFTGKEYEY